MPGTLEPVEDVCASRVVDLIKGVCVRFLDGHGIAENQTGDGSCGQPLGGRADIQDGVSLPRAARPHSQVSRGSNTPTPTPLSSSCPGYSPHSNLPDSRLDPGHTPTVLWPSSLSEVLVHLFI